MAWDFDFCSGFLPNDPSFNTNRYLLLAFLAFEMFIFCSIKIVASFVYKGRAVTSDIDDDYRVDEQDSLYDKLDRIEDIVCQYQKNQSQNSQAIMERQVSNDSTFNNSGPPSTDSVRLIIKQKRTWITFFQKIDLDELERGFSTYFGHHSICVGVCVMYCPYYIITALCIFYLFLGVLLVYLCHSEYQKPVVWVWGISCTINIILFIGSAIFVGLGKYSFQHKKCYSYVINK